MLQNNPQIKHTKTHKSHLNINNRQLSRITTLQHTTRQLNSPLILTIQNLGRLTSFTLQNPVLINTTPGQLRPHSIDFFLLVKEKIHLCGVETADLEFRREVGMFVEVVVSVEDVSLVEELEVDDGFVVADADIVLLEGKLNRGVELLRVELDAIDQLDKATKVDVMVDLLELSVDDVLDRVLRGPSGGYGLVEAVSEVVIVFELLLNFLEELLADVMEVLLELVLDNLLEDLDNSLLSCSALGHLQLSRQEIQMSWFIARRTGRLANGPKTSHKLDGLLLDVRLLVANRLDDEIVERLLIGRLDVFDEDRDTPLSRTELIEALLGPIEVEVFAVTVTITVRVTNVRGGVNVATAMRLDLIVVIRRAVVLTILVEI
ncbi:hypothetical protein KCU70_g396, partial [Aureobasidium melanogenum]